MRIAGRPLMRRESEMANVVHMCDFRSEPKDGECLEAIWSQGASCRTCYVDCYRKGWTKKRVDADNKKLCERARKAREQ